MPWEEKQSRTGCLGAAGVSASFLNRGEGVGLSERASSEQRCRGAGGTNCVEPEGRASQAEGIASAKALRLERVWQVQKQAGS